MLGQRTYSNRDGNVTCSTRRSSLRVRRRTLSLALPRKVFALHLAMTPRSGALVCTAAVRTSGGVRGLPIGSSPDEFEAGAPPSAFATLLPPVDRSSIGSGVATTPEHPAPSGAISAPATTNIKRRSSAHFLVFLCQLSCTNPHPFFVPRLVPLTNSERPPAPQFSTTPTAGQTQVGASAKPVSNKGPASALPSRRDHR